MSRSNVITRYRRQCGRAKLAHKTCSVCKHKYLAYRIFRDPDDGRQKCFPSCWQTAQDARILKSLPDYEVEDWVRPVNFRMGYGE